MAARRLIDLDFIRSVEHGVYVYPGPGVNPQFDENLTWLPDMLPGTAEFKPFRLVIDLENSGSDPKITFRVYITHSDIRYGVRKLAKWNGKTWIVIADRPVTNDNIPIWAGYFHVEDYELGDPPIAVGR
jgi:hypothetical protein